MNSNRLMPSAFLALAGLVSQSQGALTGTAESFAVLGGAAVTSTGNTVLNGNLGVSPGAAITGFIPGNVNGMVHYNDAAAAQAHADASTAYGILEVELPTAPYLSTKVLGVDVLTLGPGVYRFSSSAQLTGTLILNAGGDPNARFDFQIGSTLTTASSSSVRLINGAQADNVFWEVGSSATLGTDTIFNGSILADQSITLDTAASVLGRALAMNAAVTLDDNLITVPTDVPEPASLWLLAVFASVFGTGQWLAGRRRKARGGSI